MTADERIFVLQAGEGRPTKIPTATIQFKTLGEDTDNRFTLLEYKGMRVPKHIHTKEDENIYVLDGEIDVLLGEKTYKLTPGMFLFMPMNVPHSLFPVEGIEATLLSVSAPSGFEFWAQAVFDAIGKGLDPWTAPELEEARKKAGWIPDF